MSEMSPVTTRWQRAWHERVGQVQVQRDDARGAGVGQAADEAVADLAVGAGDQDGSWHRIVLGERGG